VYFIASEFLLKVEHPGKLHSRGCLRGVILPVSRDADSPTEKRSVETQSAVVIALVRDEVFSPGIAHE
jgi:hypothetical protein